MSTPYKYTIGFIYCSETGQTLLLNRQKLPWMGRWNGVGGKLDTGESPLECIRRETLEETGIDVATYKSRGVMRWISDGEDHGGMYIFSAEVSRRQVDEYRTPVCHCLEGILDWKSLTWILHPENSGVVDNIQQLFLSLFEGGPDDVYWVEYERKQMVRFERSVGKT